MEQLLHSALRGAQSSSSGALWRVRARTAALLGAHIQHISFSEHLQLLHRSTWIELLLPWRTQSSSAGARGAAAHWEQIQQLHCSIMSSCFPEHREQLCWSVWSSGCLGADTVALLQHVEQRLSESRYSCSIGAAASLEHRQQLCWSTWSSGSLRADTAAPLEHMEQQLRRSTQSSSAGARRAAAL